MGTPTAIPIAMRKKNHFSVAPRLQWSRKRLATESTAAAERLMKKLFSSTSVLQDRSRFDR